MLDIAKLLEELRAERDQLERAIEALECRVSKPPRSGRGVAPGGNSSPAGELRVRTLRYTLPVAVALFCIQVALADEPAGMNRGPKVWATES